MKLTFPKLMSALVAGSVLAFGGFWIGQFAPSGGELAGAAEPFSQAQSKIAFGYALIGGIAGIVVGILINPKN